jgi:MoaA/NifB/PqqE/SkfB family radical SAM enzyme
MAGAMAGTALLECPTSTDSLYAVGLTINNVCNLACAHCYLQYDSSSAYASEALINAVLDAKFELCCIVGKEPLANAISISLLDRLSAANLKTGRRTSIITNGRNLSRLPISLIRRLSWIDVSLDAGVSGYSEIRGQSADVVLSGARHVNYSDSGRMRALFTIHEQNIEQVEEMLEFARAIGASKLMFSPFQKTESDGTQAASMVQPERYLASLNHLLSQPFGNVYVTLDLRYLEKVLNVRAAAQFANDALSKYGRHPNFIVTKEDPIYRGMMRITHDGFALRPFESIDTKYYKDRGVAVHNKSLSSIFDELRGPQARTH